ncbi:MAG: tryptophan-rich sensory protein [Oscillibacter sp.]|nr:tryptophan-rich sensory protein [Oscillibacter sp.]
MKNRKALILCLLIPLLTGALSAFLTRNAMERFELLNKPPLSPPGWLFPAVWTILYLMMGAASYLVRSSGGPRRAVNEALTLYGVQLGFNFLWTILFFNMGRYLFAFFWLAVLWVLILAAALRFYRLSKPAGYLMVPYLLWAAFAGYLNLGIYLINA